MKLEVDKKLLSQMKGRWEGYAFRVGVLKNKTHLPAAPKTEGKTNVLGVTARKTIRQRRAEIQLALAKKRNEAAKLRGNARALREKGKKVASRKTFAKARAISAKMKELRASAPKPSKGARITLKEVVLSAQKETGINFLLAPFRKRNSREYRKFIKEYLSAASKRRSMGRAEKYLLDVVRQPILKKKYGSNSPATRRLKGFNRRFVDTGQLLLGIASQIKKRGRKNV